VCPKSLGMTTWVGTRWYFWRKCARRDYNDSKLTSNAPARPSPIDRLSDLDRYWCPLLLICVAKVIRNDHLSRNLGIFLERNVRDVTTTTPNWRQMPQRAHHRSTAYLISTAIGDTYHLSVWPKSLGMTTWVGTLGYFWKKNVRDVTTTTPNWRQMPQRAHHRSTAHLISTALDTGHVRRHQ